MLQPLTSPGQLSPDTPSSHGRLPLSSQKHPVAGGSSRVSANELGVQQDPPSLSPSTEKAGCPIPQEVSRHTAARGAGRGEERSKLWVPKATTPSRGLQRGSHAPTIPRSRSGGAATKWHLSERRVTWQPGPHALSPTGRGTARARGDHAGLPRPAHGAGRGGGPGEGRRWQLPPRGGQWRLGAGRFGPAGGWMFTLMHRDAAAVPVAINQRVLGPASLVWANATASNHFLHTMGDLVLQWHGPVARDHLRGSWGGPLTNTSKPARAPHTQPPGPPARPARSPSPPAHPPARPLAHSGFAAQSLTFRTGVRSHVLADSPHLPATASSSSSSSAASSLPTSTRPLTPPPEEGTHNQAGLRTGALGGSRWARGGKGGEGAALPPPSVTRRARRPALRPAWGRRPGEARPACAPPRPQAPAYLQAFPSPPRTARRRRGVRRWGTDQWSRLLGAAGVSLSEGSGARAGLDVRPSLPRGHGARVVERPRAGRGPESLRGVLGASRGTGNLPEGLCLENWPAGNNGWERVPASMKGVMKHGFLQLAALTSQDCGSFTSH